LTGEGVITNSIGMHLKSMPAGKFTMGSENGTVHERPPNEVTLTIPFYLGVYEVTEEQYERVIDDNPSIFMG
jgi:formylglycine-generating enzyme required for sulfatase activity